jgi:hypothetical protein
MGGKKKKKGKKKKAEKKAGDDDDEVKEEFNVVLPSYGWIRLHMKLCDPPTPEYNSFRTVMRSNSSIRDVKKRIIDYHGRIENINLYNTDPYPARNKGNDFKKELKPRVPPSRHLEKLMALKKEKDELDEQEAIKAKKTAEGQAVPEDSSKNRKDAYSEDQPDPNRFAELAKYDFPEDHKGEPIVHYEYDKMTLYDIFGSYGTEAKPKEDPRQDPEPPAPKEKVEKLLPSPPKKEEKEKDEEDKEGEDLEEPESPSKVEQIEEEPEEVFIPPDERVIWYDFDAFDGKDPVLLALMHRGENDTFTL